MLFSALWTASSPASQTLRLHVYSSLERFSCIADWKRRRGWWVDQVRQDNHTPADLWRVLPSGESILERLLSSTLTMPYRR